MYEKNVKIVRIFPEAKAYSIAYQRDDVNMPPKNIYFSKLPKVPWKGMIENLFFVLACDSPSITLRIIYSKKNEIPKKFIYRCKKIMSRILRWEIDACITSKQCYKAFQCIYSIAE